MQHPLAYAQRRTCTNRHPLTTLCLEISVVLVLLVALWLGAGHLSKRLRLLESQRLCLGYNKEGSVVYDGFSDSANARSLVDGGLLMSFDQAMRPAKCLSPVEAWCNLPPHGPRATLFLHRRLTPYRKVRLVVVETDGFPRMRVTVVEPGNLLRAPRVCPQGDAADQPDEHSSEHRLLERASAFNGGPRFLGGVADPTDQSHFTLPLIVRNRLVNIDGWLKDDDTVTFNFNLSEIGKALAGPGS